MTYHNQLKVVQLYYITTNYCLQIAILLNLSFLMNKKKFLSETY